MTRPSDNEAVCHEEVTRKGELQPCEKPAVALRIDPNEGTPYPVCVKHTRADMVPLSARLAGAGAQVTEAAVEAAADGLRQYDSDIDSAWQYPAAARAALSAALPHMGDGRAETQVTEESDDE